MREPFEPSPGHASRDQHEAMTRAYLEDVFNRHNLPGLDKYMSADMISHWLGDRTLNGMQAWKEGMEGFFTAFPDAAYTLNDVFFAGDKGVWRGTWRATQRGDWEGIAPTGRKATWTVIIIGRFAGGKLAEDWVEYDRYNLFRQLGAA
jgi:predicted ester cyclase